jgi:hypothetical protein
MVGLLVNVKNMDVAAQVRPNSTSMRGGCKNRRSARRRVARYQANRPNVQAA